MKKLSATFIVLLISGCSLIKNNISPPDLNGFTSMEITEYSEDSPEVSLSLSDEELKSINQKINEGVKSYYMPSDSDTPLSSSNYYLLKMNNDNNEESYIYSYKENGKHLLEVPHKGVWEIDGEVERSISILYGLKRFVNSNNSRLEKLNNSIEEVVDNGNNRMSKKKLISITFDDGPSSSSSTNDILEILNEYNAKATFFQLGSSVERNPDMTEIIHNSGHEIANHSYSHKDFARLSCSDIKDEIDKTNSVIKSITGEDPRLARVPYGSIDSHVSECLSLPNIDWSLDTKDWQIRNAEIVARDTIERAVSGDIILLHDIHEPTVEATRLIVDSLTSKGFIFVTVSDMFRYNKIELVEGLSYYSSYLH